MSGPIRVLQVFAQMNRGGAETMIMNLYRNIDRSKVQFDFIVHTEAKCAFDNEIYTLGGKIFRMPRYTGENHFRYKNEWHDFFKEHTEYKIIHGHVRSTASIYLAIAGKCGLTTIAHSHSTSSGKGIQAVVKAILQKGIPKVADYCFACSGVAGKWLFADRDFTIIKNAIDISKYTTNQNIRKAYRKKLNIEDQIVYSHVGRFHESKNHKFLLQVFKQIHRINDRTVLVLVGDGQLRKSIENEIVNLHINDSVVLLGVRSDVPELLQASDCFLLPSLWEGFPVSIVEAQAAGLPCYISDTITRDADLSELVHYLPIKKGPELWAQNILEADLKRKDVSKNLIKAGFDVVATANQLTIFYEGINKT